MKKVYLFIVPLVIVLMVGVSFSVNTATAADETINLKFAHWAPPAHPITKFVLLPWTKDVEKRTNGRVKIAVYGGGSLGSAPDHYDLALKGTADITFIGPQFTPGVFPLTDVMNLPMLFPSSEIAGSGFWELYEKYLKDTEFGKVKVLWGIPTSTFELTTRQKPVYKLEDLKGLKLASVSPVSNKIIKQLGGVPVFMPAPEVYTSVERGLVDGVFYGWDSITAFGISAITKYRTDNIHLGINFAMMIMNKKTWNNLPPDIQKIIEDMTGAKLTRNSGKVFDKANINARAKIVAHDKKVNNPPIYLLSNAERERWTKAVLPIYTSWAEKMEKKGLPGKAVLKDMNAWVEKYSK